MAEKEHEKETFLGKRHQPQKTGLAGFRQFLWNKEERKFLGRTGISWLEITIFYIIFYSCLAAFWAISLAIFVFTLDDKVPRWYGKGTVIGINPGVGYQPWLTDNPDSTLIYINTVDDASYAPYVEQLDKYLAKYDDKNMTRVCGAADSNADDDDRACVFDTSAFAPDCTAANQYGYAVGTPCVVISLNRLIGWRPLAYPTNSAPASIADRYRPGDVTIECRGENAPDVEHLGEVVYMPQSGMDKKYFPYKVMANYHQPVAMVKFKSLTRNVIVQVECLAYAYNIIHDAFDRMGLIHFEVLIDDHKAGEQPAATTAADNKS